MYRKVPLFQFFMEDQTTTSGCWLDYKKTISKHGWIMLCASLAPCTIQVDGKTPSILTSVTFNYQTSHSSTTGQFVTACTWYRQVYVNFSSERLHFFPPLFRASRCCTIYRVVLFRSAFQAHFWKIFHTTFPDTLNNTCYK